MFIFVVLISTFSFYFFTCQMNNLVARIRAATQASNLAGMKKMNDSKKPQYEYDSDEDTEGGTWEHKKRASEMMATYSEVYW